MDIIIGAGVTGLSYAAMTANEYLLLEAENSYGGYCRTIKRNGFVWDYSGHFFHFRHPRIEAFVCRHIRPETLRTIQKQTKIYYKGRHIDFPFQKNIHQLAQEEFIDCLYDLFQADPSAPYTTFKEMVYAHLGASIAEKFLIPYNEKLYACDLDRLDAEAMGRFFPKADREEIVANFRNRDNRSYNSSFVYPEGGAADYIESIACRIDKTRLCLNEKVLGIDIRRKKVRTERREIGYDRLISTLPFPQLLRMCGVPFDPTVYTCNKVVVFNLGFDRKGGDTCNHWIYFPEKRFVFYRVGYYDNIFGTDRMSLYVETGFPEQADTGDTDTLLQRVLSDLQEAGIVNGQRLTDHETIVMNPAYVHINRRHLRDITQKKAELARSDVYSIGRYGSWTYCSIEDNILEAEQLATQLKNRKNHE